MTSDRRMPILLGALGVLVALAAVYSLFLSGGDDAQPAQVRTPTVAVVPDPGFGDTGEGDGLEPAVRPQRIYVSSGRDPFAPLIEEEQSTTQTSSDEQTSSDPPKSSSTDTSESADSSKKLKVPAQRNTLDGESKTEDSKPSDDPKPSVKPKPVDGKKRGSTKNPAVRLVSVTPQTAVVRINGERERLDLAVPGSAKVTYMSPLGPDCGWFAQEGERDRYTICEGETVVL